MIGYLTTTESSLFDPFQELQQQMDRYLRSASEPASIRAVVRGSYPPINVGVTPAEVDVFVFAAGLDAANFDISIQQNLLTIAGGRPLSENNEGNYYLRERFGGQFRRVVSLPEDIDVDELDATYRDGVLRVRVQRREAVKPRQITIT